MKKITILTRPPTIPHHMRGDVGLLFEFATDSNIAKYYPNAIPLEQLFRDNQEATRQSACDLATKLLHDEPAFRGIQQLTIFHESISVELFKTFLIINLYHLLLSKEYTLCEFITPSWWADGLNNLIQLVNYPFQIQMPHTNQTNRFKKGLARLRTSKFNIHSIYSELNHTLNHLDPYHRRSLLFNKLNNKKLKNKYWFYSTSINYTNIGLLYEPYFPEMFHYLVTDKVIDGLPLTKRKRNFSLLYDFAQTDFIPKKTEINTAIETIQHHLQASTLHANECLASKLFYKSNWLKTFFTKLLPQGLFSSTIFDNWFNQVEPSLITVGNQVFEGYILQKAKQYHIPTVLLQHGVMSDYYKYVDYPADHYFVRGKFFHERLNVISQKRSFIINPPTSVVNSDKKLTNNLVFITIPHFLHPVEIDMDAILITLLQTIKELPVNLIIRVHPLERIDDYKIKIDKLLTDLSLNIHVDYNQGGNLEMILKGALAGILFQSTTFLDCIKYNIPIISFNWHQFSFKQVMKNYKLFHFAENLNHFQHLIIKASQRNLHSLNENTHLISPFHSVEETKSLINEAIKY